MAQPLQHTSPLRACSRRLSVRHLWFSIFLSLALTFYPPGLLPAAAQAGAIVVTTTADSGPGSLRQAVADANPGDTITFNLTSPAVITLTSPITVDKELMITGPGQTNLAISGGNTTRIFEVTAGTLRISDLTIQNGYVKGEDAIGQTPGSYGGFGGAVFIGPGAGMTATRVAFADNRAVGGNGGDSVHFEDDGSYFGGGGGGPGAPQAVSAGFGGGGGGGYAMLAGGQGGFGGGGGGSTGSHSGAGSAAYGGAGGSGAGGLAGYAGGGGGAGLGGAIFISEGGSLGCNT